MYQANGNVSLMVGFIYHAKNVTDVLEESFKIIFATFSVEIVTIELLSS